MMLSTLNIILLSSYFLLYLYFLSSAYSYYKLERMNNKQLAEYCKLKEENRKMKEEINDLYDELEEKI